MWWDEMTFVFPPVRFRLSFLSPPPSGEMNRQTSGRASKMRIKPLLRNTWSRPVFCERRLRRCIRCRSTRGGFRCLVRIRHRCRTTVRICVIGILKGRCLCKAREGGRERDEFRTIGADYRPSGRLRRQTHRSRYAGFGRARLEPVGAGSDTGGNHGRLSRVGARRRSRPHRLCACGDRRGYVGRHIGGGAVKFLVDRRVGRRLNDRGLGNFTLSATERPSWSSHQTHALAGGGRAAVRRTRARSGGG